MLSVGIIYSLYFYLYSLYIYLHIMYRYRLNSVNGILMNIMLIDFVILFLFLVIFTSKPKQIVILIITNWVNDIFKIKFIFLWKCYFLYAIHQKTFTLFHCTSFVANEINNSSLVNKQYSNILMTYYAQDWLML